LPVVPHMLEQIDITPVRVQDKFWSGSIRSER
jgi:hypothetical protein